MVRIQDGSLVPASELLTGGAEDDEGNKLEFKSVKEASIPTYKAERKMDDGTGRTRIYQFSFDDTNVTVHQSFIDPQAEAEAKKEAQTKQEEQEKKVQAAEHKAKLMSTEKAFHETPTPKATTTSSGLNHKNKR